MPNRFTKDDLTDKALLALREAAQEVRDRAGPTDRSAALRFALAYLANEQDDRIYVIFWSAATRAAGAMEGPGNRQSAEHSGRLQTLNNALGFIHRAHGRDPPDIK